MNTQYPATASWMPLNPQYAPKPERSTRHVDRPGYDWTK